MKEKIISLLSKEVPLKKEEIKNLLEVPPKPEMGDYALPCFTLAKKLKKSPLAISEELTEKIRKNLGKQSKEISSVDFQSAYINFFLNKKILAEKVLKESSKQNFGKSNIGKNKQVVIDMSSPNIAKPFGIGHLRSTIIGNSLGEISKMCGYKVKKINYLGDWGTQFGKLIFAYKKWGEEKKLKNNPIKHLQELYVKANSEEEYDEPSRKEFQKLEQGEKENLDLWRKFKKLSLEEFNQIYKTLGVKFDTISGESKYNGKMKSVVKKLRDKKILKKDDGAEIVNLEEKNLGVALIQKSDGTSLYTTRDLAAAIERQKEYKFDKLIYETGQEQKLHFKQVFEILKMLGFKWANDCEHVSHGLYLDKDGKKFATRKGKTIYMKDILEETIEKAKKNLKERSTKLSEKELQKRAHKIALAAIFYGDLKNSRENNIIFDLDRFLSFEGDTGPYLLYSYARASSITRKTKDGKIEKEELLELKPEEVSLIKQIQSFPEIVEKAYKELSPSIIANYSFELSQKFNEFYHACPVLGGIEENFRLKLVESFRKTLKKSLALLGIDVLEEM